MKMIDVSHWQGNIDWNEAVADGVKGVYIKATEGSAAGSAFVDGKKDRNYRKAKAKGIETGFYHYAKFVSVNDAKAEADWFIRHIKNKDFTMPPMLDLEENNCGSNKKMNKAAKAFLKRVEKQLGSVGLYSFGHFYRDKVSKKLSKRYAYWHARYANSPINEKLDDIYMWQYSSDGRINGINGPVDMNKTGGLFFTLDKKEMSKKKNKKKKGKDKMSKKKLQKQINQLQDALEEKADKPSAGSEPWDTHKEAFEKVTAQGILDGSNPHKHLSREQFASAIVSAIYPDYDANDYAEKAIEWAKENDISDGSRPAQMMTRQQGITIAYRTAQHVLDKLENTQKKDEE